jgi:hypothetical protein
VPPELRCLHGLSRDPSEIAHRLCPSQWRPRSHARARTAAPRGGQSGKDLPKLAWNRPIPSPSGLSGLPGFKNPRRDAFRAWLGDPTPELIGDDMPWAVATADAGVEGGSALRHGRNCRRTQEGRRSAFSG